MLFNNFNSVNMNLFNIIPTFSIPLVQIDEKLIICITSIILGVLIGHGILKMYKESSEDIARSKRLENDISLRIKFNKDQNTFDRYKINIYTAISDTKSVKHLGVAHVVMENILEKGIMTKKFIGSNLIEGADKILIPEQVPQEMPKTFSMNSLGRLTPVKARLASLPVHIISDMFIPGERCGVVILNTESDLPKIQYPDDLYSPFSPKYFK